MGQAVRSRPRGVLAGVPPSGTQAPDAAGVRRGLPDGRPLDQAQTSGGEVVMPAGEKAAIATTVAHLRRVFGIPADPARRGPVPLARFLEECNLLHVSLPRLTRSGIIAHLADEGFAP